MGKSPARWIKSVLFGKKSRSTTLKENEKDELLLQRRSLREMAMDPTSALHPNASKLDAGMNLDSGNTGGSVESSGISPDTEGSKSLEPDELDAYKEEVAASKIQAAFKGYLARRAYQALRGIIRMQALIRGHLVRKQAAATLQCVQRIVKMQATFRGNKVRRSDIGVEVSKIQKLEKTQDAKPLMSSKVNGSTGDDRLCTNAFVHQLLDPSGFSSPLRIHYHENESNSAISWLERWTLVRIWEPAPQPKKSAYNLPSHGTKANGHHSIGSGQPGRLKRSTRKLNSFEDEKSKRNLRKLPTSSSLDQVHEQPLSELEKVKRSLRKVSTSAIAAAPILPEAVSEKPRASFIKSSDNSSDAANKNAEICPEKVKAYILEIDIPNIEIAATNVPNPVLQDQCPATGEFSPSQDNTEFVDTPVTNVNTKVRQIRHENEKISKKKVSAKIDENGVPLSPTLPRYMAATQSAKAKLLGQNSPSSVSDEFVKITLTKNHSSPMAANGKARSPSLRAQRQLHANGKSASRNERSMLSSRDGNERAIPEWRR